MVREFPAFKRYAETDPVHFWGAYGNRIGTQLVNVVHKLITDPTTRQAVITLWNATHDNVPHKQDYPCTVALGFRQRGTHLNMNVTMRSNDVWLGLPYDLFQFTQLQLSLCHVLDLTPGTYTHTAWSMHLYEENLDESYRVTDAGAPNLFVPPADGIGTPRNSDYDPMTYVIDLTHTARFIWDVAFGVKTSLDYAFTESERWYLNALTPSKGKNGEV